MPKLLILTYLIHSLDVLRSPIPSSPIRLKLSLWMKSNNDYKGCMDKIFGPSENIWRGRVIIIHNMCNIAK